MGIGIRTRVACAECGRVFDLMNAYEADQFYYGHDCEDEGGE
jgi:hypothetical protein